MRFLTDIAAVVVPCPVRRYQYSRRSGNRVAEEIVALGYRQAAVTDFIHALDELCELRSRVLLEVGPIGVLNELQRLHGKTIVLAELDTLLDARIGEFRWASDHYIQSWPELREQHSAHHWIAAAVSFWAKDKGRALLIWRPARQPENPAKLVAP